MKLDLYRDADGLPRARGDEPDDLLAHLLSRYLEADVQGSPESARRLLEALDRVEAGDLDRWEGTGNAYTLIMTPGGAFIEPELEEEEEEGERLLPLTDLRAALEGWLALLASRDESAPEE